MAVSTADNRIRLGCLHFILAYCLATYAASTVALNFEPKISFFWILIAPVSVPAWLAIGYLFIGNSELPADAGMLMLEILSLVVLFAASIWLVSLAASRIWLSLSIMGTLVLYLCVAAIILA